MKTRASPKYFVNDCRCALRNTSNPDMNGVNKQNTHTRIHQTLREG